MKLICAKPCLWCHWCVFYAKWCPMPICPGDRGDPVIYTYFSSLAFWDFAFISFSWWNWIKKLEKEIYQQLLLAVPGPYFYTLYGRLMCRYLWLHIFLYQKGAVHAFQLFCCPFLFLILIWRFDQYKVKLIQN